MLFRITICFRCFFMLDECQFERMLGVEHVRIFLNLFRNSSIPIFIIINSNDKKIYVKYFYGEYRDVSCYSLNVFEIFCLSTLKMSIIIFRLNMLSLLKQRNHYLDSFIYSSAS